MAMQGNLQVMSVADLIQHNCQDSKTARLVLEDGRRKATLFFKEGGVSHAVMGQLQGEEVVYEVLGWSDAEFTLEVGLKSPQQTITRSWSGLLLTGAQRLDEAKEAAENEKSNFLSQEKKPMAKKKSELLADALAELLQESSDIQGVAVVGVDGLVYSANVPQKDMDENMVGATSAAIFGLSRRSAGQLKRGGFKQTLIQGDDGNILVASLNAETLFIGLTPANVNLGMAFAELRSMIARISQIL